MIAEKAFEHGIECVKIASIVEPYSTPDYMFRPVSCLVQDGKKIPNRLFGLCSDIAAH